MPSAKKKADPASKKPFTTGQLDGLLGHLSCSQGLYSKETFTSLYSCITRMVRDHQSELSGLVITRTLGDEAFEVIAAALDNQPNTPLFRLDEQTHGSAFNPTPTADLPNGFLMVLTNRLCALLFWSPQTEDTFRLYDGGWTFHPGDTRTAVEHALPLFDEPDLLARFENTQIDRRYDDRLNALISALVNGLENRNRELTVALGQVQKLNHQMVQSERLAAIGQLSSVIAHEIRNPLGLIDLYAKLIEGQVSKIGEMPEPDRDLLMKNLSQVRQATSSLETILSELTSYARPLTLQPQVMDLTRFVSGVCEFYRPSYEEKNVALVYPNLNDEHATESFWSSLDPDRIRQALINLLKNALEVSESGHRVTVTVASRKKGDDTIYVKVADQGKGIDTHASKKLFTPYFSTKQTGTGLGLAHSRKILQAHGGNVELLATTPAPDPAQGCVFAMILPRLNHPDEPASMTSSGADKKPATKKSGVKNPAGSR